MNKTLRRERSRNRTGRRPANYQCS